MNEGQIGVSIEEILQLLGRLYLENYTLRREAAARDAALKAAASAPPAPEEPPAPPPEP